MNTTNIDLIKFKQYWAHIAHVITVGAPVDSTEQLLGYRILTSLAAKIRTVVGILVL